ncbi:ThiF family adenylyltransferase [Paenibacillus glycinis]|uniref:Thiazole biosynthesis adenylyltransferase ThiF n=1 Tax=Paenibacillus glycinis TaxID=2697035 RepID=A0ABW9XS43_9BACL|nr:ThiF family adenylyltransferase [Paenibacillus glycinis]NBD25293.1 thiazole biosynthesis adenylyltransferase ThiF [Paenibacillus glycinis]
MDTSAAELRESEEQADRARRERYSRQMLFAPIGESGQRRIEAAQVAIVGMGALGTVIANHLARAGVGRLRIIDRDYVERSNLQRQMLYDEDDVLEVRPKVIAAERRLKRINGGIAVEPIVSHLTAANAEELLDGADLVLDGTDNFGTRLLLNDVCFKHGIPFIYGGAVSSNGMSAVFVPGETSCLRCLLGSGDSAGDTCDTAGVISPIVDIVASLQAVEALKLLVGAGSARRQGLLSMDIWRNGTLDMKLPSPSPTCPTCGLKQYPSLNAADAALPVTLCGRETVQIGGRRGLDLDVLKEKLARSCALTSNPYLLRAELPEGERLVIFPDGRVLVQGTEDLARAQSLYDRYVGS